MQARIMDRTRHITAAVIIVAAALFVYRPAMDAYFFDDDFQWLVSSWSFRMWNLVDVAQLAHFYRPVIDLYFAAATRLFGGSPALFHGANIALHAANALLLFAFARETSGRLAYAFLTALFFVVQPADVDAVAWVGALAEPIGAFFGCLALLGMLQFRRTGRPAWYALSLSAFLLALLTHESSVVFLPLLILADWTFTEGVAGGARAQAWNALLGRYAPYALLLAAYLAVNLQINSRNYVVTEGYYGVGFHAVTNALDYVAALYVGRRDAANYALIAIGVPLLLLRGHSRARFATAWVVLALLPFVFFTWGTTSRYLYLPAMGFAMLLADGVLSIDRLLARRLSARPRAAVLTLVAAALTARFMLFAVDNVRSFSERTEAYREYAVLFREIHGDVPSYSRVKPDPRLRIEHEHRFVNALIQWEYRDPTIELIPDTR